MVRLQRNTSLQSLFLVVSALVAAGFGFGLYTTSGLMKSVGTQTDGASLGSSDMAYGLTWASAYASTLLAGLVLIIFAAKGTRLICTVATLLAAIAGPLIAVIGVEWAGA